VALITPTAGAGTTSYVGVRPFGCATTTSTAAARCLGFFSAHRVSSRIHPGTTGSSTTVGYTPTQLRAAYNLTSAAASKGTGETVAIVDAYDDPNAAADLAVYRSAYGLPACTVANGCFRKVSQTGGASLPTTDYNWAVEESLDVDMVSAICPLCHILLVEASTANTSDLGIAENTAATTRGVVAISNSWGAPEDSTTIAADGYFKHSGVAITAAAGDSDYGVLWPAASPYVTAVGGTSLSTASNARGWAESVWQTSSTEGTGSGCSTQEPKPTWQKDTGCAHRTNNDVAAVADPNTGVAIYDTYNNCGSSSLCDLLLSLGLASGADGWVQVGGTSASTPIIASVYALAGNATTVTYGSYPYGHTSSLHDVTTGSNGTCGTYLCTAEVGYDGPTGWGTPNGTGAF
jgi:subtilase family serine protease